MRRIGLLVLLLAAACSAGPEAPPAGVAESVCASNFCADYPGDWEVVQVGDDFAVFRHPLAGDSIVASVGQVNMELLLTAAGTTWPQRTDDVVRAFWGLLEAEGAELASVRLVADGSVRSFGALGDGRLWHRLVPTEGGRAVGVEIRAPNTSWQLHADVFLDGLDVDRGG